MTINKLNIPDLTNVGDLIYFDGPLMSLFVDKAKGHFYVFDWVNAHEQFNQWIAYQVSLSCLSNFMKGILSHRDLLRKSLKNEFLRVDIDDNLTYYKRNSLSFEQLPTSYLPEENTYFLIK